MPLRIWKVSQLEVRAYHMSILCTHVCNIANSPIDRMTSTNQEVLSCFLVARMTRTNREVYPLFQVETLESEAVLKSRDKRC